MIIISTGPGQEARVKQADAVKASEAFIAKLVERERRAERGIFSRKRAALVQEDVKLVREMLLKHGLDLKRLDGLAKKRNLERQKLAEEESRHAVKASKAVAKRLRALTPKPAAPASPQEVLLDQAVVVRTYVDGGSLSDYGAYPDDNFAQYRYKAKYTSDGDPDGRRSFFWLWKNGQNKTVFVSSSARLMVNAKLKVSASGAGIASIIPYADISGSSKATVTARTKLYAMWAPDMTVIGDSVDLAEAKANAGWSDDSTTRSIAYNDLLPAPSIAVPKQSHLMIEVELLTVHRGEEVDLDAESGAFRVDQPTIALTLTA